MSCKPQKRTSSRIGLVFLLIVILLVTVSGYKVYRFTTLNSGLTSSSIGSGANVRPVTIKKGWNTSNIAGELKREGIINNSFLFKLFSRLNRYDGKYREGIYNINSDINYDNLNGYNLLMKKLTGRADMQSGIKVTIPEGKTYKETEEILSGKGLIDKSRFDSIADSQAFSYSFIKYIPKRENRLEGYLFPNTYSFDPNSGEKSVIETLLKQFDKVFKPEYYKRAAEIGMTPDQIVILASIIEREAKVSDERKVIAGVLYNRLNSKDKSLRRLQVDATIQYVLLNTQGAVKERLTLKDLKMDTPYNTYTHQGLPPGPICSPGEASIKAALYPDENDYMYYVAKDDGSGEHYFSRTYKEHLSAKAKAKKNRAN